MADSNLAIASLVVTTGIGQLVAEWSPAVDPTAYAGLPSLQLAVYEVYVSSTSSFSGAVKVGETTGTQYIIKGLAASVTRRVWVRARDKSGNNGEYTPLSSTSGVSGTTSTILPPSNSITNDMMTPNSIGSSELQASSVVAGKLAANSVQATNLQANSVVAGKLAADSINTSALFVDGVVITDVIAANAVTTSAYSQQGGDVLVNTTAITSIFSGAIAAKGNRVAIQFTVSAFCDAPDASTRWYVYKGGTLIGSLIGNYCFDSTFGSGFDALKSFITTGIFEDPSPGTGTVTYTLYASKQVSGGGVFYATQGKMFMTNFKK